MRLVVRLVLAAAALAGAMLVIAQPPTPVAPRVVNLTSHRHVTVDQIAFSPDGRIAAVSGTRDLGGAFDPIITLWAVDRGQLLYTLRGNDAGWGRFDFSPDGKVLALADRDRVVLREAGSGAVIRRLKHPGVTTVQFSPAGKHLLSTSAREVGDQVRSDIRVWDYAAGRRLFSPAWEKGEWDQWAEFAADGRLRFLTNRLRLRTWDPATGAERPPVRLAGDPEGYIARSRNGTALLTSKGGQLQLYDTTTGEVRRAFGAPRDEVPFPQFTPDGRVVLGSLGDGRVEVWDAETGKLRTTIHTLDEKRKESLSEHPTPDGKFVVAQWGVWTVKPGAHYDQVAIYAIDGRLVRRETTARLIKFDAAMRTAAVVTAPPVPEGQTRQLHLTFHDAAAWLAGGKKE